MFLLVVGAPNPLEAQTPQFSNLQRLTNREASLQFSAPTGSHYRLMVSTNLSDTNAWQGLLTLRSGGLNQHTDSAAPFAISRYYRAEELPGTNHLTGDHLPTSQGDAVIHPVNHASFVMSWNGKMTYNDPVNGAAAYAAFPKADLILISHSHSDHYDFNTINGIRSTNAVIVVPQAVYNLSSFSALRPNAVVLGYGQSTNVAGLTIEAWPAYNGNHAYGINNAYVLNLGGRRIFTSGDTGDVPELRALVGIDVAFLCMNVPFTTSAQGATNLIRSMRPKIVYPYHYRDQSGTMTNAAVFKQWLGQDLGIEVRLRGWY